MASPIVSLPPGTYPDAQTVTVTFPPGVRKAIVTHGNRTPVLSEVLAYDTGVVLPGGPVVERPFLAVTQDGKGNVVYDGGFPKYYNAKLKINNVYPAIKPVTWEAIPPAFRLMVNAFKFCANPQKVAEGKNKVLCISNTMRTENYGMMLSHYNPSPGQPTNGIDTSFKDSFEIIGQVAGFEVECQDCTTYNGAKINLSFTDLDQYALVVFMSSIFIGSTAASRITPEFAQAMAAYREQGNGVIVITDHTDLNYTSIDDGITRGMGFVKDANIICQYYGTYFTGSVRRSPLLVSEIRRQIGAPGPPGDHPLLNQLADTEYIFAGDSESLVIPEIYPDDLVDPSVPFVYDMPIPGTYRVNVLMQMDDGSIVTQPLQYVIGGVGTIAITNTLGAELGTDHPTVKRAFDFQIRHRVEPLTTMSGDIIRNGFLQGYFTYINQVTMYQMFSGTAASMPIQGNDVVGFDVKAPYEYNVRTKIIQVDYGDLRQSSGCYPRFVKYLRGKPEYMGYTDDKIMRDITYYADGRFVQVPKRGNIIMSHVWSTMGKARLPFNQGILCDAVMWIAANPADWDANKPANPSKGTATVIASTNEVYYWETITRTWIKHPQPVDLLIGYPRYIVNTRVANERWTIGRTSTTKV